MTHLVEMISYHLPNARPLQPDAVHVVVGDLHDLLQAEHAGLVCGGQLVHGHGAEPPHKVHCKPSKHTGCFQQERDSVEKTPEENKLTDRIPVQPGGAREDPAKNIKTHLIL